MRPLLRTAALVPLLTLASAVPAHAALWTKRSPEERQAAQSQRAAFRAGRSEFRSAVRSNGKLTLRHTWSLAGAAGFGGGLGAATGGLVLHVASMPAMMFDRPVGKTTAVVAATGAAITAAASAPMYYNAALGGARTTTVKFGVARGVITRDTAMRWEKSGLIDREWRQRYALDGLPELEPDQM